jgi:hypothetical protein
MFPSKSLICPSTQLRQRLLITTGAAKAIFKRMVDTAPGTLQPRNCGFCSAPSSISTLHLADYLGENKRNTARTNSEVRKKFYFQLSTRSQTTS